MATYSAGTATIDVLPSLSGFHRSIRKELAGINPEITVPVVAETRQLTRQIATATRNAPTVQIAVEVERRNLARAIAEVGAAEKRLQSQRDASTDAASGLKIAEQQLDEVRARAKVRASQITAAELKVAQAQRASAAAANNLKNATSAVTAARDASSKARSRVAEVETAPAESKLRAFAARAGEAYRVKLGVDPDLSGAAAQLATFRLTAQRIGAITLDVHLDTGAAIGKLAALSAAGSAVGFAVGGGIGLAGAAIAGIPAAVAVALGPLAALGVGLQGVGDAFTAFSDADDQAAQNATANAKQQAQAARQIVSARQQVTQAQTQLARAQEDTAVSAAQATRRISDAERQVVAAQRSRLDAQQAVTRAVEDATRAQRDLRFQVEGGALAERQAVLDLADAQAELAAARTGGDTAEITRATLAYEQQDLALREVRARNVDLVAEQATAARVGVDGAEQVVSARQREADAAVQVADAEQGVVDARTEADRTAVAAQRTIADAQLSVAQAQTQLTNALADAGTVGAASTDKIKAAMDGLSPSAQGFVLAVRGLKPEWDAMTSGVQESLFSGLGPVFTGFAQTVLPQVATNLGVVSTALNGAAQEMFSFLSTPEVGAQMSQLFAGIGQVITALVPTLQVFIDLFLNLATAAMPGIVALVEALGTIGTAVMAALQPLIDSGAFTDGITMVADVLASLAPIIAQVLPLAIELLNAIGPALISTVQALSPVIAVLGDALVAIAPVLGEIVSAFAQALLPVIEALAPVLIELMGPISTLLDAGLKLLVPIIQVVADVMLALMPAVQGVADVLASLMPVVAPLIEQLARAFMPLIEALTPVIVQLAGFLAEGLTFALETVVPVVMRLVEALTPIVPMLLDIAVGVLDALMPVFPGLIDAFMGLLDAVLPILPQIVELVDALLPVLIDVIGILVPIVTGLADALSAVLGWVISTIVVPALDSLIAIVQVLSDVVSFLWRGIFQPVFSAIGDLIGAVWNATLKPIFELLTSAAGSVGDAFRSMGDTISGIWDGIKDVVRIGVQTFVDIVYNDGLRAMVNAVIQYVPGVDYLPEIRVPAFATGGPVRGPGTGTSDSIPALLSNGEYVINAGSTRDWLWLLEAINAGRYASGGLVGYAAGGMVAAATPATWTAAAVTIDPAALAGLGEIAEQVTAQVTGLALTLTTVLDPAVAATAALIATVTATTYPALMQRQEQVRAQTLSVWQTMGAAVATSTSGQAAAMAGLQQALGTTRAAMAQTADWATSQFDRMRAAAADPIRYVITGPLNSGLVAAWNRLDSDFALGKHLAPLPVAFASGGAVRGPGTGTSDSIRALLSDGEFVVRAAVTKRTLPFLEALNSGDPEALQATGARRYATGGLVADTGSQYNASLARGLKFAQDQDGKPYVWGAVGPDGYDCSGFMSALTNVLRGEVNPHRRLGVARSQPWPGFVPGLSSSFATGFSATHTAGTLAGINVEAGGSPSRTKFGAGAVGADSAQFGGHASLPLVGGQFAPGGGAVDLAALIGPYFADTYRLLGAVTSMFSGSLPAVFGAGMGTAATDGARTSATSLLTSLTSMTAGTAGSPEVKAAVRSVAAGFGWGDGAQWAALDWLLGRESGWNPNAANPTSSARGLFQKMTSVHGAVEPTAAGQAQWGLNYIKGRYGDPLGAQSWWQSHRWYDDGGVASGVGFLAKNTLEPERVLSPAQTRSFDSLVANISRGGVDSGSSERGDTHITVYLGNREITDIVRVEIDDATDRMGDELTLGRRT